MKTPDNEIILESVNSEKDLGIIIDKNLISKNISIHRYQKQIGF